MTNTRRSLTEDEKFGFMARPWTTGKRGSWRRKKKRAAELAQQDPARLIEDYQKHWEAVSAMMPEVLDLLKGEETDFAWVGAQVRYALECMTDAAKESPWLSVDVLDWAECLTRAVMELTENPTPRMKSWAAHSLFMPWLKSPWPRKDYPGFKAAAERLGLGGTAIDTRKKSQMDALPTRTVAAQIAHVSATVEYLKTLDPKTEDMLTREPFKTWLTLPPLSKDTAGEWWDKAIRNHIEALWDVPESGHRVDERGAVINYNTEVRRLTAKTYRTHGAPYEQIDRWRDDCRKALRRLARDCAFPTIHRERRKRLIAAD